MVLWRELKRMNQRSFLLYRRCVFFWFQATNRFRVFEKFIGCHSTSFEIPPPSRAGLTTMIFKKLACKPLVISGLGALQQLFAPALPRIECFRCFFRNFTRLWKVGPGEFAWAQLMQPIEQRKRGPAVLLVVSSDLPEELIIVAFAPVLVIDNRL